MKIELVVLNENEIAEFLQIKPMNLFCIVGENSAEKDFLFEESQGDPREFTYLRYKKAKLKLFELQSKLVH